MNPILLAEIIKGWFRDAVSNDMQIFTEARHLWLYLDGERVVIVCQVLFPAINVPMRLKHMDQVQT